MRIISICLFYIAPRDTNKEKNASHPDTRILQFSLGMREGLPSWDTRGPTALTVGHGCTTISFVACVRGSVNGIWDTCLERKTIAMLSLSWKKGEMENQIWYSDAGGSLRFVLGGYLSSPMFHPIVSNSFTPRKDISHLFLLVVLFSFQAWLFVFSLQIVFSGSHLA